MKRRVLLAAPLLLAACGLSERPYAERRDWPLDITRPQQLPPRQGGNVLLVRALRAGPGLEARGLQSIQPDGSIRTAFYEEWSVPPAQGAEDALRRWLGAAGLFAAVIAPGSRVTADLTLEGELTALWTEPGRHVGRATVAITVIAQRAETTRIQLQRSFSGEAALEATGAPADAAAMRAALADVFAQIETALAVE